MSDKVLGLVSGFLIFIIEALAFLIGVAVGALLFGG